jgi:catechol 2,3-dioxygenase-like lactoylglutathione lyase family enzyme
MLSPARRCASAVHQQLRGSAARRCVSRLTLGVPDVAASVRFHKDALGLWLLPATAATPAAPRRAVLGGGDSTGCTLEFFAEEAVAAPAPAPAPGGGLAAGAGYCVAVSNLAGAWARVPRKGGAQVRAAGGGASAAAEAPAGHAVRMVHSYRRAPLLHVWLRAAAPRAAAAFYAGVAGLQEVDLDSATAAAAGVEPAAVPSGTVLLRNPRQPAAAALLLVPAPASGGDGGDALNGGALTIRLDGVGAEADAWACARGARARAEALRVAAGPVEAVPGAHAAAAAFTCLDVDGHAVYLVHGGGGGG